MSEANSSGNSEMDCEIEQVDRLSSLPDSILTNILSFLPTEDAAKCVLLRLFGTLWSFIQTLEFNGCIHDSSSFDHHNDRQFLNFVDQVLLRHRSPTLDKFCLKFSEALASEPPYHMNFHVKPSIISHKLDAWLQYAVEKKVKILELDVLDYNLYGPLISYDLPDFVLTSDTITDLKLVSCILNPIKLFCMTSLKTLSLRSILLSDRMIEDILLRCPLVENLFIIRCPGLYKLNLVASSLKNFELVLGEGDSSEIEICCSTQRSLKIKGSIGRAILKNATSVLNATLDFFLGGRYSNQEYYRIGMLLGELSHAKLLTLCGWCVLVLAIGELTHRALSWAHLKKVNLKARLTKWHLLGIVSLLKNSPILESLTIHVEPETSVITSEDQEWLEAMGIYQNNFWNDPVWLIVNDFNDDTFWDTFTCFETHLRIVRIHGYIKNEGLIQFVKFLLRSSAALEKMAVSFNPQLSFSFQDRMELVQMFESSPKASDKVEFVVW